MHAFWETVASNSLVVVVLAAGVALLGRFWKNPAALHLLWVLVLVKLVTLPIVTVPVPLPVTHATLAAEEPEASQGIGDGPVVEAFRDAPSTKAGALDQRVSQDGAAPASTIPSTDVAPSLAARQGPDWRAILAWTWGVGVALMAFARALRIDRFRRLLHAAQPASSTVLGIAEGIARRLGLRRIPEVAMLPVRLSPLVWSLGGRPRVLLPAALFERLDAEAQEALLAHELAHVRRKDHWVRLLELVITALFWWHPVVWWTCRQLRELEEQCCDSLVLGTVPHGARAYATALLDTLDFLSEQSVAVPLLATGANSSDSLARRIKMLKNHVPVVRLTVGRILVLLAAAAIPMVVAFAAEPPQTDAPPRPSDQQSAEKPAVQRRAINKLVKDFPEKTDLSTPESALAAFHRVCWSADPERVLALSPWKYSPRDVEEMKAKLAANKDVGAIMGDAYRNAEIIEVLTYRDGLAAVISKLKLPANLPEGGNRDPYRSRSFVRIDGAWKNFGESGLPTLEEARKDFDRKKDIVWENYVKVLDGIKKGKPVRLEAGDLSSSRPKRSASIAPGQPLGISVEKADLMGRIEWAMMHGMRNVTARKTIEWGEIEKDEEGNRTIRYKYFATIWDKDIYIMNQVFTFDAKGNILNMDDVERFPQKKVEKPVNVGTQEGMKELVEDFFSKNFRDITSRENIQWGEVTKAENGNSSIRYKYLAKIWDKDTKIMNQVFTFDPKGKFVSVKNVEGFPRNP
jgi:beta-lactamase regulating signal transducer with metallopeptidase domain